MPEADLDLVVTAATAAGKAAAAFDAADPAATPRWDKPDDAGPLTAADLASNAVLEEMLRGVCPDYGWLSEESPDDGERLGKDDCFIVDPIDGTRSFIEGSNSWAVSVAVARGGLIRLAAVYLPKRDKLYTAERGKGAFLNGAPISVTPKKRNTPEELHVLTTKASLKAEYWHGAAPGFRRHFRPSLAYRMALAAEGRFDAMLTFRPSWEWDIAAGALLVEEAGGLATDCTGAALRFNQDFPKAQGTLAGQAGSHKLLLERARIDQAPRPA